MNVANLKVAILGAGGLTGQVLVGALAERNVAARAVIRHPDYAERLPAGVEFAVADFNDINALVEAFHGCTTVYQIPPSFNEGEEDFVRNVFEAMKRAGTDRLVYHSVLHPTTPGMPHHLRKSRVELLIRESDLTWTILQPAMYVQTVLSFLTEDRTALRPPFDPDQPFNILAPVDLAGAVERVLSDTAADFATFEIAGSERLTLRQMAEKLSETLGVPIRVEIADLEETVASRAKKRGWSARQQKEYRAMLQYYDRYGLPGNGLTLETLLGRPATPFAQAAKAIVGD